MVQFKAYHVYGGEGRNARLFRSTTVELNRHPCIAHTAAHVKRTVLYSPADPTRLSTTRHISPPDHTPPHLSSQEAASATHSTSESS